MIHDRHTANREKAVEMLDAIRTLTDPRTGAVAPEVAQISAIVYALLAVADEIHQHGSV